MQTNTERKNAQPTRQEGEIVRISPSVRSGCSLSLGLQKDKIRKTNKKVNSSFILSWVGRIIHQRKTFESQTKQNPKNYYYIYSTTSTYIVYIVNNSRLLQKNEYILMDTDIWILSIPKHKQTPTENSSRSGGKRLEDPLCPCLTD